MKIEKSKCICHCEGENCDSKACYTIALKKQGIRSRIHLCPMHMNELLVALQQWEDQYYDKKRI